MSTVDLKKRSAARQAILNKNDLTHRADARKALLKKTANEESLEKRAQARQQILDTLTTEISLEDRARKREAYMQGGPGPNDPKNLGFPGELKYPRMEVPVGGDSRQWEQTWFEGAAEVSKQKMGPSGVELELKKKLQRASDELRGLGKKAKENPKLAKVYAAKIANELNSIITDMDKAGYLAEAQSADEVLEEIAAFIAKPTVTAEDHAEDESCADDKCSPEDKKEDKEVEASVKSELIKLANVLDKKGYLEEANEIDQILADL